jgi:hypothetical protein
VPKRTGNGSCPPSLGVGFELSPAARSLPSPPSLL